MPLTGWPTPATAGSRCGPRGVAVTRVRGALPSNPKNENPDMGNIKQDPMPVIRDLADFDRHSGNLLERLVFNYRPLFMRVRRRHRGAGLHGGDKLVLNASFEKMIPQSQPYIQNYLTYQTDLRGLGNSVRVVVENTEGDIFDPQYLEVLKQVNDELFLTRASTAPG